MVLLVFVLLLSAKFGESLFEGDSCDLTSGNSGVCTELTNCRSAFEELKLGNTPDFVCGYSGFQPIVCCPRSTSVNTTTPLSVELEIVTGATARQKCGEYSRYTYVLKPASLLIPNQHSLNVSECGISTHTFTGVSQSRHANPAEFPFMTAIGYDLENGDIGWYCDGALISETFVLTAAHCTDLSEWGEAKWVRFGNINLIPSDTKAYAAVDRRVIERIRHPEYKPPIQYHDIALLRLDSPVAFNSRIRPACIHTTPSTDTQLALVTRWDLAIDDGSYHLKMTRLHLVDSQICNATWTLRNINMHLPNGVVRDWSICAEPDDDTCQVGSGGPMVIYSKREFYCMYDIVGVTGSGKLCNDKNPTIYTRVYYYLRWIESTVWGQ